MNLNLAIKGALGGLPDAGFDEAALLRELAAQGMSAEDSRLALEKAILDGFVERTAAGALSKLPRAFEADDAGRP
ncbi:hypothetical protein [Roseateles violae]|uniref:Uncharacterized protein n=1 Tax=Roseateles violae TaxID=3058042 RepID=A0ABT8DY97_9BURK|nr:hypothetical protein [Pelomonas sp. PFR6]MDN3922141.1 hypothetical protein [Pelomonas sp. PFR6]